MEKDYAQLALCMKALADETRLKIVDMLTEGELCACTILEEFNITQPTLSYHMKVLCERGLVTSRKDGIWMRYSLNRENLDTIKLIFNDISQSLDHSQENYKETCRC